MSKLFLGWSEISITPDKKVSLLGQFAERISEYVEKPLTATALAMEKDGDQAVLVSCDLCQITVNLVEGIRAKLADNPLGLDPGKVSFNAIHTHTGPGYPSAPAEKNSVSNLFYSLRSILADFLAPGQKYVEAVNVSALEKFEDGAVVDAKALLESGILSKCEYGVKILGNGSITKKLTVQASAFSASAKEKIEAAGGKAEVI